MAITWGAALGTSSLKVGIEVVQSPAVPTAATDKVTLTVRYYARAAYSIADNQTLNMSGAVSGAVNYYMGTHGVDVLLATRTLDVPLLIGASNPRTFNASIGGYYSGQVPSVSLTHSAPARPIDAPATPTSFSAARQTDAHVLLGWTSAATSTAPYESVLVERSTNGGAFVQIATVSGAATGYNDYGIGSNAVHVYRIRAKNAAGASAFTSALTVATTPAAPTGCTAVKTGAESVVVGWVDASQSESQFAIQRSVAGGAWTNIGTATADTSSFADTTAPAGTITYRVRAERDALVSDWSAPSAPVTTIAPPAAPTMTPAPLYTEKTSHLRVGWAHSTLDGSAQSEAQVRIVVVGVSDDTFTVAGATAHYDLALAAIAPGTVVRAQARTKGLHADWSAWSSWLETTIVVAPSVAIVSPASDGASVEDIPLVVAWDFTDDFTQLAWGLKLVSDGREIASWNGGGESSQPIGSEHLENLTDYELVLSVRSGSGLSATASRSFSTDYIGPAAPVLEATFDTSALLTRLIVTPVDDAELPETVRLSLLRIEEHLGVTETIELVADVAPSSEVIDRLPRLGGTVRYRALAHSDNGAYTATEATVSTRCGGFHAINFGVGFTEMAAMRWNQSLDRSTADVSSEALQFAGRELPVLYSGEHVESTVTVTATVDDPAAIAALGRLAKWKRPAVLRERDGSRSRVRIVTLGVADGGTPHKTWLVTLDMQEVE